MDRQQILLAKSLEAAEVPLHVTSFHDRLILQKSVYLLQCSGIHIGYRFRWYIRGPYSPDMTAGAFGIVNEGAFATNELQRWKLDADSVELARNLRPLLHRKGESKTDRSRRLELLASILFLYKTEQAKPGDPDGTSKILKKNDKHFEPDEVRAAVKELKAQGLLA